MELKLSDSQWCVLDLLMRARDRGVPVISRTEILNNQQLPAQARTKLVWAALTMPDTLVHWVGPHNFAITDAGISAYELKFGKSKATTAGDLVICLPDQTRRH